MATRILLTALLGVNAGCDQLPGSDAASEAHAKRAVAALLIDGKSAEFRNVRVIAEAVCGEVNAKNKMGAYVGFSRFLVSTKTWQAQTDPNFDSSSLGSYRDLCSSAYAPASACSLYSDQLAKQAAQTAFDSGWERQCEKRAAVGSERLPYDPTSGTALNEVENWQEQVPPAPAAASPTSSADEAGPEGDPDEAPLDNAASMEISAPETNGD
jgi:hypothetical protein